MICPKGSGHVHPVISLTIRDQQEAVCFSGVLSSIPADFWIKTTGKGDLYESTLKRFPILSAATEKNRLLIRTLALNCLTTYYVDLWSSRDRRSRW